MPSRELRNTPQQHSLRDALLDDILNHSNDTTYDVLYIPLHETQYSYHITCSDLTAVSKDRQHLARCLIQASHEARHPRDTENPESNFFPEAQPFKITRVSRQTDSS